MFRYSCFVTRYSCLVARIQLRFSELYVSMSHSRTASISVKTGHTVPTRRNFWTCRYSYSYCTVDHKQTNRVKPHEAYVLVLGLPWDSYEYSYCCCSEYFRSTVRYDSYGTCPYLPFSLYRSAISRIIIICSTSIPNVRYHHLSCC